MIIQQGKWKTCDTMDVLILCGGYAKRLMPVSEFVPKPMLPVQGKPIVEHILGKISELPKDAVIGRIIINTNKRFEEHFRYWIALRNPSYENRLIEIAEPTKSNDTKLGAIAGIDYCIRNGDIKGDLMLMAGDNFYDFGLGNLVSHFQKSGKPTISLYDVGSKEDATRFGVVELDGDVVSGFEEKPERPKTALVSAGMYIFPADTLHMVGDYIREGNPPDMVGNFISWLIKKTEVHGVVEKGRWVDIGTLESYRKLLSELDEPA